MSTRTYLQAKNFTVDSVLDFITLPVSSDINNLVVTVSNFSPTITGSEMSYIYDSSEAKANHDGYSIISPTVPWDGTTGTLAAYEAGTGETDGAGSGCWKLVDVIRFVGGVPTITSGNVSKNLLAEDRINQPDGVVGLDGSGNTVITALNIPTDNSGSSLTATNQSATNDEIGGRLDAADTAATNALSRANHTGTQTASTISDFDTEVSNNASVVANTAKVSADGSVTSHSDITDAGSGAIITVGERAIVAATSGTNTGDQDDLTLSTDNSGNSLTAVTQRATNTEIAGRLDTAEAGIAKTDYLSFETGGVLTAAPASSSTGYALGDGANAAGANCIAIGTNSQGGGASNPDAIAIGRLAAATGTESIAIGYSVTASNLTSIAIGHDMSATGLGAVAIGFAATSSNNYSIALGRSAAASAAESIAIGFLASASGGSSVVVGDSAACTAAGGICIGDNADISGTLTSVVIGQNAQSGGSFSNTIVGANSGSSGLIDYATCIGSDAIPAGDGATCVGFNTDATTGSIAVGRDAKANVIDCVAIGHNTDTALGSSSGNITMVGAVYDVFSAKRFDFKHTEGTRSTDATPSSSLGTPLEDGLYAFEGTVLANEPATGDVYHRKFDGCVQVTSGTAAIIVSNAGTETRTGSFTTITSALTVSTNTLIFQATGEAAKTINWGLTIHYQALI